MDNGLTSRATTDDQRERYRYNLESALYVACVRYACDEVVRILDLSEDEYYMPYSGFIYHILRWVVMALTDRCGRIQCRLDIMKKVKESIGSRYTGRGDVCDSDKTCVPFSCL